MALLKHQQGFFFAMKWLNIYIDSFKGLSKDTWCVAMIYLINRCGEMVIPFMSIYLTSQLGFSKTQSGFVLFFFGVGAMMGSNLGGYLTDRIGHIKVMAISLIGAGITFMGIVLFKEFYSLCAWMVLSALFSSMFSPPAFSAVSSWEKEENQTRGFSLLRMAINLGVAIGPAIGGFLAYQVGYYSLFLFDGFTCLLAAVVLLNVLKHKIISGKNESIKELEESPYSDRTLVIFLLFNLINMIAFFQILFTVPVYFKEELMMDERLVGAFFTANGILVFLFEMPLVHRIEKANKFFPPMILGAVLIGIAYFGLGIFTIPLVAIIWYSLLVAFGEIINFPLIPSLAMIRSTPENQGKFMGAVSMMFAASFAFAPLSGLPVVDLIGYTNYWYLVGFFSVASGLGLHFLRPLFMKNSKSKKGLG